jgi:hypothetical protein
MLPDLSVGLQVAQGNQFAIKTHTLLANLHPANQAAVHRVDMLHHPIDQKLSRQIPDHLVDSDHYSSRIIRLKFYGIDVRIDHAPLPRPIFPNARMSVNRATFHTVRPLHVRPHGRQSSIHIPRVKCPVSFPQHRNVGTLRR